MADFILQQTQNSCSIPGALENNKTQYPGVFSPEYWVFKQ